MNRSEFISRRLRELLIDGTWIANTNFKKQIEAVSFEQAVARVGELNTIAMLTFHVNYYIAGLNNVFRGGALEIRDKYSFDMQPLQTENDWQQLIEKFVKDAEEIVLHVAQITEEQWEQPFVKAEYGSYWRNIEGTLEHSYYHLGQISLLKKMTSDE